jgi:hypothetical protein
MMRLNRQWESGSSRWCDRRGNGNQDRQDGAIEETLEVRTCQEKVVKQRSGIEVCHKDAPGAFGLGLIWGFNTEITKCLRKYHSFYVLMLLRNKGRSWSRNALYSLTLFLLFLSSARNVKKTIVITLNRDKYFPFIIH